jgi:hypothetical protein
MNTTPNTVIARPSIVKDAMVGLFSAIAIGLLSSLTFVLVVLFLSSHAFA